MLKVLRKKELRECLEMVPLLELLTEPKTKKKRKMKMFLHFLRFCLLKSFPAPYLFALGYIFISLFGDYEAVFCVRG